MAFVFFVLFPRLVERYRFNTDLKYSRSSLSSERVWSRYIFNCLGAFHRVSMVSQKTLTKVKTVKLKLTKPTTTDAYDMVGRPAGIVACND